MKISDKFSLGKNQFQLDFVDIDPDYDLPLFIEPYILARRSDSWSADCTRTVKSFFDHLITLLKVGKAEVAEELFSYLGEPNETCLGLSEDDPQGRGVGSADARNIFGSLKDSKAVRDGILEELQDCFIFVENFGKDKLSDLTTNLIRRHLITYTQSQCRLHDIPLTAGVQSGNYWDRATSAWKNEHTEMLVIDNKKILLVPKGIVTFCRSYTPYQYHQHFVLNFLQAEHVRLGLFPTTTETLKNGTVKISCTKDDLKKHINKGSKSELTDFTLKHPEVFKRFKQSRGDIDRSLDNNSLNKENQIDIGEVVDHLIAELSSTRPGDKDAGKYHTLMVGILDFLFYPHLIAPEKEVPLHGGRKRVDIVFDNAATEGIFHELHQLHKMPCQFIFVECKNFTGDPGNPELDQLSGRFSVNRGRVGLLACRDIEKLPLFLERCRNTYADDRGLIIPLTDQDILEALERKREGAENPLNDILRERRRRVCVG